VPNYLLDACALIALLNDENGADIVSDLLDQAKRGEITLSVHAINLIEVYYDCIRVDGLDRADAFIKEIYNTFPVNITESLDPAIVREAACLKAAGKMSLADTILVATAFCTGATVVTCDHVDLEQVEQQKHISILWIRPKF
jgi:predicted nucleic acid-binding protein